MELSEAQSVLHQQLHVLPGNAKGRWNCQRGAQCSKKFTYLLEMRKQHGIIRGKVSAQSTNSRTSWKSAHKTELSVAGQCSIKKFAYILEMRERDGIVRATISRQSSSRTFWECTTEMESSGLRSVLRQQVHVHPENVQTGWNCQRCGQYPIEKFTYQLEMGK